MYNYACTFFLITLVCYIGSIHSAFAQIKSQDAESVKSRYVVTDSSVFEYFIEEQGLPYKICDFSTRNVYVYFGNEKNFLVSHSFSDLDQDELMYIIKIGCNSAPLSSGFRRFCK